LHIFREANHCRCNDVRRRKSAKEKLYGVYLAILLIPFRGNLFWKQRPFWNSSHFQYRYSDSYAIAMTTAKSLVNSCISVSARTLRLGRMNRRLTPSSVAYVLSPFGYRVWNNTG
jgi:hypothetical protein